MRNIMYGNLQQMCFLSILFKITSFFRNILQQKNTTFVTISIECEEKFRKRSLKMK